MATLCCGLLCAGLDWVLRAQVQLFSKSEFLRVLSLLTLGCGGMLGVISLGIGVLSRQWPCVPLGVLMLLRSGWLWQAELGGGSLIAPSYWEQTLMLLIHQALLVAAAWVFFQREVWSQKEHLQGIIVLLTLVAMMLLLLLSDPQREPSAHLVFSVLWVTPTWLGYLSGKALWRGWTWAVVWLFVALCEGWRWGLEWLMPEKLPPSRMHDALHCSLHAMVEVMLLFMVVVIHMHWRHRQAHAHALNVERQLAHRLEVQVAERTAQLARSAYLAERESQVKSSFLAKLAHETRTPLHLILGYLGLLLNRSDLPDSAREMAKTAHDAGLQLATRVGELLDFTQLGRELLRIESHPLMVDDLYRRLCGAARLLVQQNGHTLDAQLDPLLPQRVLGDLSRLEQVVMVFLNNAARYTPRGGRIGLSLNLVGRRPRHVAEGRDEVGAMKSSVQQEVGLRFEVRDTGRGFSAYNLMALREALEHGTLWDGCEGLGLGLNIAHQLLALMRSRLEIETSEWQGSCVACTVWLPELPSLPTAHGQHLKSQDAVVVVPPSRPERPGVDEWHKLATIARCADLSGLEDWLETHPYWVAYDLELRSLTDALAFDALADYALRQGRPLKMR
ncbi:Protein-serine/threonine phosphatase [Vitreoscilla filiformis]|uniref:histidine kinase n=2 Tax=Vitreoscilla filiformis TaxID=63 RepID=A0A221KAK3_VITFI|nr:Protein-serine/threonine phosphatase [Vitreoscilla filiformis]